MSRVFIRPYHKSSKSAKALKEALGIRALRIDGESKYNPREGDFVINWGNASYFEHEDNVFTLNPPFQVRRCINKGHFFRRADEMSLPIPASYVPGEFDEIPKDVPIVARTMLRASQGRGAYYFDSIEEVPDDFRIDDKSIKVITKYVKKYREFRVHVMHGQVIDCVEKKKRKDVENVDWKIRNHKNGWVFCRNDLKEIPNQVREVAVNTVLSMNLHFGAVDVVWNDYKNQAVVLEVNTAPGLEETTLNRYVAALGRFYLD